MICEKCGNDYPSTYYFATPTICKKCFENLPEEEKQKLWNLKSDFTNEQSLELRAKFGKRFLAAFVDFLLISVIVLVIYKFNGFLSAYGELIQEFRAAGTDREAIKLIQEEFFRNNAFNLVIPSIITFLYFLSEGFVGVSLGKYILGLVIAKSSGEKATPNELWVRYIVKNSSGVLNILWVLTGLSFIYTINSVWGIVLFLGFFLILSRNRQNIQDIVAKTALFKVDDLESFQNLCKDDVSSEQENK